MNTRNKYIGITKKIISKWKKILKIDPIWEIEISALNSTEMSDAAARIDVSNSEYYRVYIDVNENLFLEDEKEFVKIINRVACHELIHLATADYHRTSALFAQENDQLKNELVYKYEQLTTKFEKILLEMQDRVEKLEKDINKQSND